MLNEIVVVPTRPAVRTPVEAPIVATAVELLLQVLVPVASVYVVVVAWHTAFGPTMAAGIGLTVAIVVAVQPTPVVYVMLVVPADTPHTLPEVEPVAIAVAMVRSLLLHAPPETGSVSVTHEPTHTTGVPTMAAMALTVNAWVTLQPVVGKV
jgi:hypothetical protein